MGEQGNITSAETVIHKMLRWKIQRQNQLKLAE